MSMKAKLQYTVRTTLPPGAKGPSYVPALVDRLQPTELEGIVEKCIDRGLIAGLKPTAAKTIAEGVAEQLAHEFKQGNGIKFGDYFYGRPYLSGTVDGNGRLSGDNDIDVRLYKGDGFKLDRGDFSLSYVDGGNNPKIDFVVSDGAYDRGTVVKGGKINVNGSMLWAAGDAVEVKFSKAGSDDITVSSFDSTGASLLSFDCPAGLVAGNEYTITVSRTDENLVTRVSGPKLVKVVAGATPPTPEEPTITEAYSTGETSPIVNVTGDELFVKGTNLETATQIKLLVLPSGDVFETLPATWDAEHGYLKATLGLQTTPSTDAGAVLVTTDGGNFTFDVTYQSM